MKTSSNLHLIWDDTGLDDIDDDTIEEACVGSNYNLQSKGAPKISDFPSTLNTIETLLKYNLNRLKIFG